MTVCLTALALDSRVVVCVADKSVAYGDKIQWDSDSSKMFQLQPSGAVVMFSGAERAVTEVMSRILAVQDELFGVDKSVTRNILQTECKKAIDFLIERLFLSPNQLTREEYIAAISGPQINTYIKSIADEITGFELDCSLLICGTEKRRPFILSLDENGIVSDFTNLGYGAIGAGWEYATARLLFSEHERAHDIERTLYDVFDAKANAEMTPYVGYEWDAWIYLPGKLGLHAVPKDKKKLIEQGWAQASRSPFEPYDKDKHVDLPPDDWKEQLREYADSTIFKKVSEPKNDT
jgi:hypothetical protein